MTFGSRCRRRRSRPIRSGSTQDVPMADYVDIGVFGDEVKGQKLGEPLLVRKVRITEPETTLDFVVDEGAAKGGHRSVQHAHRPHARGQPDGSPLSFGAALGFAHDGHDGGARAAAHRHLRPRLVQAAGGPHRVGVCAGGGVPRDPVLRAASAGSTPSGSTGPTCRIISLKSPSPRARSSWWGPGSAPSSSACSAAVAPASGWTRGGPSSARRRTACITEMRMYWHRWSGGRDTSKP